MSETKCPTCGREDFKSKSGMRTHHYKVHGESISYTNLFCEYCGDEFKRRKCEVESNNKNFCSSECNTKYQIDLPPEEHDCYEGGEVDVDCAYCGEVGTKSVYRKRAETQDRFFCDAECLGKYNSKRYSGENNPNYKGGDWEHNYRGEDWAIYRNKVRQRDNNTCQNCNKSKDDLGQYPDCHHIIPERRFKERNDAHYMENLVLLCRTCHNIFDNLSVKKQRERLK